MAKSRPPPKGSSSKSPPGSSSPSTELMARARRAADRATTEVKTEILDQDQLPLDLDDMTMATLDPRRRLKPQASPKKEVRQEEDGRQAEVLLKSFLAASRTRDATSEQPEKKDPPPPKPASPAPPPSAGRASYAPLPAGVTRAGPPPPPEKGGALHALNQAQPPGVFFNEQPRAPGSEETEDPALAAAVEEAISTLFGVRGIHHVGPGQNETGESVVVIAAGDGFGEAALQKIPPSVGDFKTLVTLPYELLPLRRSR